MGRGLDILRGFPAAHPRSKARLRSRCVHFGLDIFQLSWTSIPQCLRGVTHAAAGTKSPAHAHQLPGLPWGSSLDYVWQAVSAPSLFPEWTLHKCLIQTILSSLMNPPAIKSFPTFLGSELLQDVCYRWPCWCLLRQNFYFPSHTAASGRHWFMPMTCPVLELKGSQGESWAPATGRCWSRSSVGINEVAPSLWMEPGPFTSVEDLWQESEMFWYVWVYWDIWLLKSVCTTGSIHPI